MKKKKSLPKWKLYNYPVTVYRLYKLLYCIAEYSPIIVNGIIAKIYNLCKDF